MTAVWLLTVASAASGIAYAVTGRAGLALLAVVLIALAFAAGAAWEAIQ